MSLNTLERLWALADQEAFETDVEPDMVFDPIGLLLVRPLTRLEYHCTPLNSTTFAETGGDGVHYGLLRTEGSASDESPVVMTVPCMFESPNLIVGTTLHEFLCLGCQVGYFWLEQLVYERAATLEKLLHPEDHAQEIWFEGQPTTRQSHLLAQFVRLFDLKPWDSLVERLDTLQDKYLHLVVTRTDQGNANGGA
jgi:hypothetical protein